MGAVVLAAISCAALVFLLLPRWVEGRAIAAARERGVVLSPGELRFGWGWVQMSGATAELVGVDGVRISIRIADVALNGMTPKRFALDGVEIEVEGRPVALLPQVDRWVREYSGRTKEPLSVTALGARVRAAQGAAPLATLSRGTLRLEATTARLEVPEVVVLTRSLGAVRALREGARVRASATLGIGGLDAPVLDIERTGDGPLRIAVGPLAVREISRLLGMELPNPDVIVTARTELPVPTSLAEGITASTALILAGYVPPHPVELDGFVFGSETHVTARFALEPQRFRVAIDPITVKAGAFALSGNGELRPEGLDGRLTLVLRGTLPCAALASATAESRLGRALGKLAGQAARQTLTGSVGVRVAVDVTTSRLSEPRILKTIVPGCGLKALGAAELVALGELAPDALNPQVMEDFERLLRTGLPKPPSDVRIEGPLLDRIEVPGLGTVPLPLPGATRRARSSAPPPSASAPTRGH